MHSIQQYEVSLSRMLNDISDFQTLRFSINSSHWIWAWPSPNFEWFPWIICKGCQQGTLNLPDTWFRPPFGDCLVHELLRPDSSNLSCLYSTFHLEFPLVLSRFRLVKIIKKYFQDFYLFYLIIQLTVLSCLIELFCGVVFVVTLPFWHFCWRRGFCHRTWSDLLLFVLVLS